MYSPDYRLVSKVQIQVGGALTHDAANLLHLVGLLHYSWKKCKSNAERQILSVKLEKAEKNLRVYYWSQINPRHNKEITLA